MYSTQVTGRVVRRETWRERPAEQLAWPDIAVGRNTGWSRQERARLHE
jgi:hypothetical protein